MSMSKKDFIGLADEMNEISLGDSSLGLIERTAIIDALCRFMAGQNPKFKEDKWREYLANGGAR